MYGETLDLLLLLDFHNYVKYNFDLYDLNYDLMPISNV